MVLETPLTFVYTVGYYLRDLYLTIRYDECGCFKYYMRREPNYLPNAVV